MKFNMLLILSMVLMVSVRAAGRQKLATRDFDKPAAPEVAVVAVPEYVQNHAMPF